MKKYQKHVDVDEHVFEDILMSKLLLTSGI